MTFLNVTRWGLGAVLVVGAAAQAQDALTPPAGTSVFVLRLPSAVDVPLAAQPEDDALSSGTRTDLTAHARIAHIDRRLLELSTTDLRGPTQQLSILSYVLGGVSFALGTTFLLLNQQVGVALPLMVVTPLMTTLVGVWMRSLAKQEQRARVEEVATLKEERETLANRQAELARARWVQAEARNDGRATTPSSAPPLVPAELGHQRGPLVPRR